MKTILIVEDVQDNRELLRQFLEGEYHIVEAADGKRGLELAVETQPDLILMDLSLPLLDGWQAATAIKANDRLRGVPIVAITAHAMVGDQEKALQAGCDAYIAKPVDFDELEQLLKRLLGSK